VTPSPWPAKRLPSPACCCSPRGGNAIMLARAGRHRPAPGGRERPHLGARHLPAGHAVPAATAHVPRGGGRPAAPRARQRHTTTSAAHFAARSRLSLTDAERAVVHLAAASACTSGCRVPAGRRAWRCSRLARVISGSRRSRGSGGSLRPRRPAPVVRRGLVIRICDIPHPPVVRGGLDPCRQASLPNGPMSSRLAPA
jgi:hypothetical protein